MTNMASKSHDEDLARETHEKNDHDDILEPPTRWSMGVLNDKYTNQVPGMPSIIYSGSPDHLHGVYHL